MTPKSAENFRLTVLNPGGRDQEQQFHKLPGPGEGAHPPINFHAFAACTRGAFHFSPRRAIAEDTPVLLLLRSDFRASERALSDLKKQGRTVAVSLKETGLHQIAQQLRDGAKLSARSYETRSRNSDVYSNPLPGRGSTMELFFASKRAIGNFRGHARMGRAIAQSLRGAFGRAPAL